MIRSEHKWLGINANEQDAYYTFEQTPNDRMSEFRIQLKNRLLSIIPDEYFGT